MTTKSNKNRKAGSEKSLLAKNIDERMKRLGIKYYSKLSELSEVSRTVITNINLDSSKGIMGLSAIKLANTLECNVEWLLTGKGPMLNDSRSNIPIVELAEIPSGILSDHLNSLRFEVGTNFIPFHLGDHPNTLAIITRDAGDPEFCTPLRKLDKDGFLFFDCDLKPISGKMVLAKTNNDAARVCEYFVSHKVEILKEINSKIPTEFCSKALDDETKILATFIGYYLPEQ